MLRKKDFFAKKTGLAPATAARNKLAHDEKVLKKRQAHAAKMRENQLAVGELSGNQVKLALTQRMNNVPDDNPVKLLCQELGYDPLKEIVVLAKNRKTDKKMRADLNRYLVDKLIPNLKSISNETKIKATVSVQVQSFKDASKAALKPLREIEDGEYEEFDEKESDG